MDISYDGSRDDLVDFLFTSRLEFEAAIELDRDNPSTYHESFAKSRFLHEPLHYINSAGGLTDNLYAYTNPLDDAEEASNA
jgi:hypothetical protein